MCPNPKKMVSFVSLCLLNMASVYWGPHPYAKETHLTKDRMLITFAQMVLWSPFLEECIFRSGLPVLLPDDSEVWISLIFSGVHILNLRHCQIGLIVRQVCITFLFSGYLFELETLGQAILCHMLYNLIGFVWSVILSKYSPKDLPGGCYVRKRSKSCSDIFDGVKASHESYMYISTSTLPDGEIKDVLCKFNERIRGRVVAFQM